MNIAWRQQLSECNM